jgi:hypothetical protein
MLGGRTGPSVNILAPDISIGEKAARNVSVVTRRPATG